VEEHEELYSLKGSIDINTVSPNSKSAVETTIVCVPVLRPLDVSNL
jgi:hypothetical protein